MASAREKLEELLRGMRMRQEQQREAEAIWKIALPRCEAIARSLVEVVKSQGVVVEVENKHGELTLAFPNRNEGPSFPAQAAFKLNAVGKCLEGWRLPFRDLNNKDPEHFFSLSVRVPQAIRQINSFGPSGGVETSLTVDSQEAFERAIVEFLEWAMVKGGTGGTDFRLP